MQQIQHCPHSGWNTIPTEVNCKIFICLSQVRTLHIGENIETRTFKVLKRDYIQYPVRVILTHNVKMCGILAIRGKFFLVWTTPFKDLAFQLMYNKLLSLQKVQIWELLKSDWTHFELLFSFKISIKEFGRVSRGERHLFRFCF